MKYIFFIAVLFTIFSSITSVSATGGSTQALEIMNKQYVRQTLVSLYTKHDISIYDQVWSDNSKIYSSGTTEFSKSLYRSTLQKSLSGTTISIREIGAEGNWVFVHSQYIINSTEYAVFDIIKLDGKQIVEHWILRQVVPPTSLNTNTMFSSHPMYHRTMLLTEQMHRELVPRVYQNLFGDHDIGVLTKYWHPNYIQHNPMAETGRDALRDFLVNFGILDAPKSNMIFDMVLADGNLVFTLTRQNFGSPSLIGDMFRLENKKIVEHWDVISAQ